MRCEACGGYGLIEFGAYRGDESGTATRECKLCGGAVTAITPKTADIADSALNQLTQAAGVSVTKALTVDQVSNSLRRELSREVRPRRMSRRSTK